MLSFEAGLVFFGAVILTFGLYYSRKTIRILRKQKLSRPWVILSLLIAFFFLGYAFTGLRLLNIEILPFISNETIVAYVFFFGAIFVLILTYLNLNLFTDIFGIELTDREALERFSKYANLPAQFENEILLRKYSIQCDACNQMVAYSIPDIVRSHPRLKRDVIIEEGMGSKNYIFYLRHRCKDDLREISVLHDHQLAYRTHRPSRLV
jgi:hypothetical protein